MAVTDGEVDGPHNLQLVCGFNVAENDKTLDSKRAKRRKVIASDNVERKKLQKRLMLLLTRPTYTLSLGFMNARHENRIKLRYLLRKLVRQQNWVEVSGVLSALLKGTRKEGSLKNNRMKYWVAMEVLRHVESDATVYLKEIENLYTTWMRKIHSWKNKPLKDKYAKLESILSILVHSTTNMRSLDPDGDGISGSQDMLPYQQTIPEELVNAQLDARSLKMGLESASDPVTNLVIGLIFYEGWYFTIPKQMQINNLDKLGMPMESTVGCNSNEKVDDDMRWDDAASVYETHSNLHYHSETSMANKDTDGDFHNCMRGEASGTMPVVHYHQGNQARPFYADSSTDREGSAHYNYDKMQISSIFNVPGLQPLLPIRFPSSEDMIYVLSYYRTSFDVTFENALKHLEMAFDSPYLVSEAALLPLIQLLLLHDKCKEALVVLDKACSKSKSVFPSRLRSYLWDCFHPNDFDKLSMYVEDVLKKDPACRYSLARLVRLHQQGDYTPEWLVEMIALHLEGTYPDHNTWREFASCLLRICRCEQDRASCVDGGEVDSCHGYRDCLRKVPDMFVRGKSGKIWKFRCKWWLDRHFSKDILASELSAGDLQLMTNKAACASHLYGKNFEYVTEVGKHLKKHLQTSKQHDNIDKALLTFLRLHIQSSTGFYPNLVRK